MDSAAIRSLAEQQGFDLCGIAPAEPSAHETTFRRWIDDGKHGQMHYLAENVDKRLDPRRLLPGARSIVMVADRLPEPAPEDRNVEEEAPGRIARYAQVSDYHKVIKKRLFALADALREAHPNEQFKVCVDTAPLLEREHAMRAGLGWTGKHTLLINPRFGSHLMLGAIVTTLGLEPDRPETDHCGTCTRCIEACPTDCIEPYALDATRCISYLTIEHRGRIDPAFFEPIGDWLYGCDICQDVCPFVESARRRRPVTEPAEYYRHRPGVLSAKQVVDWSEQDRREVFVQSPMKRAKLEQMRRNALIVLGNRLRRCRSAEQEKRIRRLAEDPAESQLIRQTARDVLESLTGRSDPPVETGS